MTAIETGKQHKERLIWNVKREVKQIMEEAVTRKFVHEESSSITSLCGAVEACLSQGLKRRALGLFKTSSTTALIHKVGKGFEPAAVVSQLVMQAEAVDPNRRSSSSGDSSALQKNGSQTSPPPPPPRYLWIRIALFEKSLAKIIDYLVQNSSKYYEKDALVADPDYGSILSSLLVGPCALDYSKTKTQDHFWTDPPADELVQRHRISTGQSTPPPRRRTALNFGRSLHAVGSEECVRALPLSAKDYVESLHQNSRATLLYGKNNVLVLPKDRTEPLPGYLSLHQTASSLTIKWTPNQLMNGYSESDISDKRRGSLPVSTESSRRQTSFRRTSTISHLYMYWEYAMNVPIEEVVYVHCHQQADSGGTVVLVMQDGVQKPPIHFPCGGHLLSFLSCLENGLLPHGQLDPPLWSQRGRGKVFPRLRRKGRAPAQQESESSDYVFRIVSKTNHEDFSVAGTELMDPWPWRNIPDPQRLVSTSTASSSTSSSKSLSLDPTPSTHIADAASPAQGDPIQQVCTSMRRQISSRAFYGWLAYCRHLRTVRTHLSGLVLTTIVPSSDAESGLTAERWAELSKAEGQAAEIFRLTYYGGIEHSIRRQVWPYLLGHYEFGSTEETRNELDRHTRQMYETTMSEWLAVEAIVRQRDKEAMAANLAKLSSESTSADAPPPTPAINKELSNDVFEDNISDGADISYGAQLEEQQNEHNHLEEKFAAQCAAGLGKLTAECIRRTSAVDSDEDDPTSPDEGVVEDVETEFLMNKANNEPVSEKVYTEAKTAAQSGAVIVTTNPSLDSGTHSDPLADDMGERTLETHPEEHDTLAVEEEESARSSCVSPASSQGGVYSAELLETFGLNLHRIDKDVQRCDRNYWYFTPDNLEKLRNVMFTYVWEHLEVGYMQGMCDLVAPLLVIFDDEATTYACFCRLMERMAANFPHGGAMDTHFANMRSLIQILDSEMFELMHQNGDYTHFYFCYRWFLLDFKRELVYEDVFSVWETIWAAKHVSSSHFVLFIALALVETYRDIILGNSMDFTDIIKFFNEMAEHHNVKLILNLARDLVLQLQTLIENK
ncbi:small G protein signaling modulator 1-like isoform X1 [Schistocerca gregaria]|uniref:small G protein signaling modulator 1-like isoform X1 n=1 Tax=Schistocerca gregaria TaxID=7010 RepID=UPI00211E26E1|nr:small G protein signaling modulator 1-like isoform X1 [Schistocerca gregaria]